MSIPAFTQGYPPNGFTLGQTKATIRDNLDGTFLTVAVNHYDNNDPNVGKHKFIQLPTAANPLTTAASEILLINGFTTYGGLNNLIFVPPNKTVFGNTVQMTRNEIPSTTANGYSWLPGGMLIQWGAVSDAGGSNPAAGVNNFPIPFPNSVFTTIATPLYAGAKPNSGGSVVIKVQVGAPPYSNFTYVFFTDSAAYAGFTWIAIGY